MPDHPRSEAWAILSEEIARLPETYRAPVVLCYLEAMSYQAAAASLGVTEDTVRGRLARARERLRKSLACRGIEAPLAVARPAIPAVVFRTGLVQATARAAADLSAGGAASLGAISRSVISLYERTCRTMMLTKLKRPRPPWCSESSRPARSCLPSSSRAGAASRPPPRRRRHAPPKAVAAKGGNFVVDWIPADGKGGKKQITVDPKRHCIHLPSVSEKRDDRPNDGAVRVDLERGKSYKITAAGEAFMSEQTGADADPFPGVVVLYPTDEEDCYADSPDRPGTGEVDHVPVPVVDRPQGRGLPDGVLPRYRLPATPSGAAIRSPSRRPANRPPQERTSKAPSDGIITTKGLRFFEKPRSEAIKSLGSEAIK